MLEDAACEVSKRKCKNSLGQMFFVESAIVKKALLKWFNLKYKRQFEKISPIEKIKFQSKNKIDWKKDKCVIFKFPIKLEPTNYLTADSEMTYGDFIIPFEHKFLRNIYTEEQIMQSDHVKNLKNYYEIFNEYIQICVGLLALLNSYNRQNYINDTTEEFVQEKFADETLSEIKNAINKTEIKNAISQSRGTIFKFNLKVCAFVYDELMILPKNEIEYDTATINNFFVHVHRLIKSKVH